MTKKRPLGLPAAVVTSVLVDVFRYFVVGTVVGGVSGAGAGGVSVVGAGAFGSTGGVGSPSGTSGVGRTAASCRVACDTYTPFDVAA